VTDQGNLLLCKKLKGIKVAIFSINLTAVLITYSLHIKPRQQDSGVLTYTYLILRKAKIMTQLANEMTKH